MGGWGRGKTVSRRLFLDANQCIEDIKRALIDGQRAGKERWKKRRRRRKRRGGGGGGGVGGRMTPFANDGKIRSLVSK